MSKFVKLKSKYYRHLWRSGAAVFDLTFSLSSLLSETLRRDSSLPFQHTVLDAKFFTF